MAFGRNRTPTARPSHAPSAPANKPARPADDWRQSVPTADVQEGGESMWDAWQEESRRMDAAFADTQPSEAIPLADASQPAPLQRQGTGGLHWTVGTVIALARRNNRVCPRPLLWSALYVLLEGDHYADLRPPPVLPRSWASLSNLQRRLHFHEHIEWADRHGKLDELARYIASLAEPDWVHMGEA
jgi:hypothetical protein